MSNKFLLYAMVISIPLALGAASLQAARFYTLQKEVKALNEKQQEIVEANSRIITDIVMLSSTARIENIATTKLGLKKIDPKDVTQIIIDEYK
ncbi:MAG: hypothetical protein Ta2G_20330 [Termitinemataceae bacterium]|nr:MAG: hypothetical protein Ta2G_20330 [Termitinemataceae bacterium]